MLGLPAAVFSALLLVTGVAKIRRPADTSRAVAALGVPFMPAVGAMIGLTETGVGLAALVWPGPITLLAQGILYGGLFSWIAVAMARDIPIQSCGCLGTPDTPPYWGHLVMDGVAFVVSVGAAVSSTGPWLVGPWPSATASALVVAIGCLLAWLVIGEAARVRVTYDR